MIARAAIIILLGAAGCAAGPAAKSMVYEHPRERDSIIALLAHCPIAEPVAITPAEATRVANARRMALLSCNADKDKLRALLVP